MSEDSYSPGKPRQGELPQSEQTVEATVLRAGGSVQVLATAPVAHSLFKAIKASGLIVAPPIPADYDDILEEFSVEPREGESCLVVSDPDHLIADVIARWRRNQSD